MTWMTHKHTQGTMCGCQSIAYTIRGREWKRKRDHVGLFPLPPSLCVCARVFSACLLVAHCTKQYWQVSVVTWSLSVCVRVRFACVSVTRNKTHFIWLRVFFLCLFVCLLFFIPHSSRKVFGWTYQIKSNKKNMRAKYNSLRANTLFRSRALSHSLTLLISINYA